MLKVSTWRVLDFWGTMHCPAGGPRDESSGMLRLRASPLAKQGLAAALSKALTQQWLHATRWAALNVRKGQEGKNQ